MAFEWFSESFILFGDFSPAGRIKKRNRSRESGFLVSWARGFGIDSLKANWVPLSTFYWSAGLEEC